MLDAHEKNTGVPINEYFELNNGCVYKGEWLHGKPNGIGKLFYPEGSVFEGYFFEGQQEGYGRKIHSNMDIFEGNF